MTNETTVRRVPETCEEFFDALGVEPGVSVAELRGKIAGWLRLPLTPETDAAMRAAAETMDWQCCRSCRELHSVCGVCGKATDGALRVTGKNATGTEPEMVTAAICRGCFEVGGAGDPGYVFEIEPARPARVRGRVPT